MPKLSLMFIVAIIVLGIVLIGLFVNSTRNLISTMGQQQIVQEVDIIERNLATSYDLINAASARVVNSDLLIAELTTEEVDVAQVRSILIQQLNDVEFTELQIMDANNEVVIQLPESANIADSVTRLLSLSMFGLQQTSTEKIESDDGLTLSLVSVTSIVDTDGTVIGGFLLTRAIDQTFLSELVLDREDILVHLYTDEQNVATNQTINTAQMFDDIAEIQDSVSEVIVNPNLLQNDEGVFYSEVIIPLQTEGDATPTGVFVVQVFFDVITQFENSTLLTTVLTVLVASGVISVLVILVLRITVVNPLFRLQSQANSLSKGDYSVRSSATANDEFGLITTTFNQMADAVQEREQELVVINESLEERIAERTVELKTARDEAIASQRIANENSRLKSEFLSMMSHELRTPMNAIQGFTGIMLKRMAGVDYNEKSERYLNKIQSNSERLLGLINDFLDLSRIESGRLEIAHLPLSPTNMVQGWKENVSVLAENKDLEFILDVDSTLPETIYGDEEAISKIAINLVGNAIKFTETGSVTLSLKQNNGNMELQVCDTGIGIPPHARDFIFDEFRQVDQSSKRAHGGTGLGLSIVQKLAIAMGGTVSVQSEVGVGSTFTAVLPIHIQEHIS
jgi:signal transduction histidine kinase